MKARKTIQEIRMSLKYANFWLPLILFTLILIGSKLDDIYRTIEMEECKSKQVDSKKVFKEYKYGRKQK